MMLRGQMHGPSTHFSRKKLFFFKRRKGPKRSRRLNKVILVVGSLLMFAVTVFFDSDPEYSVERKLQKCIQIPEDFFRWIEKQGLGNPCNSLKNIEANSGHIQRESFFAEEGLVRCIFRGDCFKEEGRSLVKRCTSISNLISNLEIRNLKKSYTLAEIYERVLELNDGPCITHYPENLVQGTRDLKEPDYDIGDGGFAPGGDNAYYDIVPPQDKKSGIIDVIDTTVQTFFGSFEPKDYDPVVAKEVARNKTLDSIGYILPLVECPGSSNSECSAQPRAASDLYEASAVIKTQICNMTDIARRRRKLGLTRRLETLGEDTLSAADRDYQMIGMVHPAAVECPINTAKGYFDIPYDRVQLLQQLNFNVEILGQPVTEDDMNAADQNMLINDLTDEVGFQDLMKLQSWGLTLHPVVVMLDHNRQLKEPLDYEVDKLLANDMLRGMYVRTAPTDEGHFGVDTGMMIIKPSKDELHKISEAYKNTEYTTDGGWNGTQGHRHCGGAGLSGFLKYYFQVLHGPNEYEELDRCLFAHDGDEECVKNKPPGKKIKVTVIKENICGNPSDCPYDSPFWSEEKRKVCQEQHRKYFESRYQFEKEFWNKDTPKQERIGQFKPESFLGYCTEPGPAGFLPIVGSVIETPQWINICEPDDKCPEGSVMKNDCSCTQAEESPCEACPDNTICQTEPTLMCIHCGCGFSDDAGLPCCKSNGNNECIASEYFHGGECQTSKNFFPAFGGEESVCNLLNTTLREYIPQGCGCKPSRQIPCFFNEEWGNIRRKNFMCTALDLAEGFCEACKECLKVGCPNSSCIDRSSSPNEFSVCLAEIDEQVCRRDCTPECSKYN